ILCLCNPIQARGGAAFRAFLPIKNRFSPIFRQKGAAAFSRGGPFGSPVSGSASGTAARGGSAEASTGFLDLVVRLGHRLLGAAQCVLAVLVGRAAELPAPLLGLADDLVGALLGLGSQLVLGQDLLGPVVGLLADELGLPLGGGDVLGPAGQQLLGLAQLHGE